MHSREFRSLVSSLGTSARSIFLRSFREKRDRVKPRNERFGSLHETRACFDFRLRAFSLRRAEIIDAFSRFHTNAKTREPHFAAASYNVKTSASDALRDAHARSFSTLAMSGSVTRAPALACDRAELQTGIVHFGVGGFHRSHQQVRLPFAKKACRTGKRVSRQAKDAARGAARRRDARERARIATNRLEYVDRTFPRRRARVFGRPQPPTPDPARLSEFR